MKFILGILIVIIISSTLTAQTIYDDFQIRSGTLQTNQTWSGKNIISSDVVIPEHITLTLEPDTWLIYNNNDSKNLGQYIDKVELIIHGTLEQSPQKPAHIFKISDSKIQNLISKYSATANITVKPEAIDTKPITRKVNRYKRRYIASWALIYSIILILS